VHLLALTRRTLPFSVSLNVIVSPLAYSRKGLPLFVGLGYTLTLQVVRNCFPSRVHRGRVCKLSVQPIELCWHRRCKAERYTTRVAVHACAVNVHAVAIECRRLSPAVNQGVKISEAVAILDQLQPVAMAKAAVDTLMSARQQVAQTALKRVEHDQHVLRGLTADINEATRKRDVVNRSLAVNLAELDKRFSCHGSRALV
jgi:hypothetical protein